MKDFVDDRQDPEREFIKKEMWEEIRSILTGIEFEVIEGIFVQGEEYSSPHINRIKEGALKKLSENLDIDYIELLK